MLMVAPRHIPVLLDEAIDFLKVSPGGTYVDGTVGLGGHARRILEALGGTGRVIAIDRDEEALSQARERLRSYAGAVSFHRDNFRNLPLLLNGLGLAGVDGCLLDLGVSSLQLESPSRGFSFRLEGPLDMRQDRRSRTTAADLVNGLPEQELAEIFRRYGEERRAGAIASEIVRQREQHPLRTTGQLADLVRRVSPAGRGKTDPATRVFQALRIRVNQELEGLDDFLEEAVGLLKPEGRLVVIAFHSLEDRTVKTVFRRLAGRCVCFRPADRCTCPRVVRGRVLTPRPVRPGRREIEENPRSRSARLRAFEKLEEKECADG